MARTVKLLLVENVDNTGIVGDVVTVRKGFARNFLLPRGFATQPSEEMVKSLQAKREQALKTLADLRAKREELIKRLTGTTLTLVRSCNDLGILYGAITQHEVSVELDKAGFHGIKDREVRLGQPVKRVGEYHLSVKFEAGLEAEVTLKVNPDRELPQMRAEAEALAAANAANAAAALETPGEKRQKDKSAKFDTAKPGQKKDEDEAPAEPKAKGKKEAAPAAEAKPAKKGSDEAKRAKK